MEENKIRGFDPERLDKKLEGFETAPTSDEECMMRILRLAKKAGEIDEVPVGAMVVVRGRIVSEAYNLREHSGVATHHAEVLAIEEASRALGGWRLPQSTLYVTLEPCIMCAGAAINARVERIVYGAEDLRFGAMGSLIDVSELPLNHKIEARGGVLKEECKDVMQSYFKRKRGI